MENNKQQKVKFLLEESENGNSQVLAFFPENLYNKNTELMYLAYSSNEQHCPCGISYANALTEATKEQYLDLAKELESIGYNLLITNKN